MSKDEESSEKSAMYDIPTFPSKDSTKLTLRLSRVRSSEMDQQGDILSSMENSNVSEGDSSLNVRYPGHKSETPVTPQDGNCLLNAAACFQEQNEFQQIQQVPILQPTSEASKPRRRRALPSWLSPRPLWSRQSRVWTHTLPIACHHSESSCPITAPSPPPPKSSDRPCGSLALAIEHAQTGAVGVMPTPAEATVPNASVQAAEPTLSTKGFSYFFRRKLCVAPAPQSPTPVTSTQVVSEQPGPSVHNRRDSSSDSDPPLSPNRYRSQSRTHSRGGSVQSCRSRRSHHIDSSTESILADSCNDHNQKYLRRSSQHSSSRRDRRIPRRHHSEKRYSSYLQLSKHNWSSSSSPSRESSSGSSNSDSPLMHLKKDGRLKSKDHSG